MFFFKRLIKNLVVVAALGFVVRKLVASSDPRLQRVGNVANRGMGFLFGTDATASRTERRRVRLRR